MKKYSNQLFKYRKTIDLAYIHIFAFTKNLSLVPFSFQEPDNNSADNEPTKKEQNCAVNLCVEIEETLQRSSE